MKYLLFMLAIPAVAQQQAASNYSLEKEKALGRSLAEDVRRDSKPVPQLDPYVSRIGARLVEGVTGNPFPYRFEAITGFDEPDPFSFPGGYVFVPVASLAAATNEAEFARMLAHAIGHVALRHGIQPVNRGQSSNMASIPLIYWGGVHRGDRSRILIPKGFEETQRSYEEEASQFASELVNRTGFSTDSSEDFLGAQTLARSVVEKPRAAPTLRK